MTLDPGLLAAVIASPKDDSLRLICGDHADVIRRATPLERVRLTTPPPTEWYEPSGGPDSARATLAREYPNIEFELPAFDDFPSNPFTREMGYRALESILAENERDGWPDLHRPMTNEPMDAFHPDSATQHAIRRIAEHRRWAGL